VSNGTSQLYIGGRFKAACGAASANVAVLVAGHWLPLGEGVAGGVVNALALSGDQLFVGGTFRLAGGRPAGRVARWEGGRWHPLGELGGDVHALAVLGEYLFAAGSFETAGGLPASHVARFSSGRWTAVGGGVDAPAFALLAHGTCILMGGAFTTCLSPSPLLPPTPCRNLARYCPSQGHDAWEPASPAVPSAMQGGGEEGGGGAVVRAIAHAAHSVLGGEGACEVGAGVCV
ncbi:hypothetical protein T484DRAFT_1810924, partial [Baffinella frigidus]